MADQIPSLLPSTTPVADPLQAWVAAAKAQGYTDLQLRQHFREGGYPQPMIEKYIPYEEVAPDEGKKKGFLNTLYGDTYEAIAGIPGAIEAKNAQIKDAQAKGTTAPSLLQDLIGRMAGAQWGQGKEAWRSLLGRGEHANSGLAGRLSETLGHGAAALLPGLGPLAAEAGEKGGEGDFGGMGADALSLVGQIFGPKITSALGDATLGKVGREFYEAGIPIDRDLPLRSQKGMLEIARQNKIVPRYGEANQPNLDVLKKVIEDGKLTVDSLTSAYDAGGGSPIKTIETLGPVLEKLKLHEKTGTASQAAPMLGPIKEYVQKHTGVRFDPKIDSDVLGYVSRAAGVDAGESLTYWQGIKRAMGDINRPSQSIKTKGQIIESGVSPTTFNDLAERGEREVIRGREPAVQSANDLQSQAIHLRTALEDLAKSNPSKLKKLAPRIMGGAAGVGAGLLGFHMGHVPLGLGGAIGVGALADILTAEAFRDPGVMARLGIALEEAGHGSLSKIAGHLPKIKTAAPDQER